MNKETLQDISEYDDGWYKFQDIIVWETAQTHWTYELQEYYETLGYEFTSYRDLLEPNIFDLPEKSNALVKVICPSCSNMREIKWSNLLETGNTICRKCYLKQFDLTGKQFGRLTIIKKVPNVKPATYLAKCTCGTVKEVKARFLNSNETRSCGCLQREFVNELNRKRRNVKRKDS